MKICYFVSQFLRWSSFTLDLYIILRVRKVLALVNMHIFTYEWEVFGRPYLLWFFTANLSMVSIRRRCLALYCLSVCLYILQSTKSRVGLAQWHISVIPVLLRLNQQDCLNFKTSLGYRSQEVFIGSRKSERRVTYSPPGWPRLPLPVL